MPTSTNSCAEPEILTLELLSDIIPMIDRIYRVAPGRENRAITGLSMGGGQAFTMGLKNLDLFARVGEFSSGLVSDTEFDLDKYLPGFLDHPEDINKKLRLLFLMAKDSTRPARSRRLRKLLCRRPLNRLDGRQFG